MQLPRIMIGLLLVGLTGCGGDGASPELVQPPPDRRGPVDPPPPVDPPSSLPVGVWHGYTTGDGRVTTGIVLPDGRVWLVSAVSGLPNWAGAVIAGTMVAKEGESTWTMAETIPAQSWIYVDLEHSTRATVRASGTMVRQERLLCQFVVQYDPPSNPGPLSDANGCDLIYDTRSTTSLDVSTVAGVYHGVGIPREDLAVTLSTTGAIDGRTAFGCTFTGNAVPAGPVLEITVTFGGLPCVQRSATVRGAAWADLTQGRLVLAALSSDRNAVFPFIGIKR